MSTGFTKPNVLRLACIFSICSSLCVLAFFAYGMSRSISTNSILTVDFILCSFPKNPRKRQSVSERVCAGLLHSALLFRIGGACSIPIPPHNEFIDTFSRFIFIPKTQYDLYQCLYRLICRRRCLVVLTHGRMGNRCCPFP